MTFDDERRYAAKRDRLARLIRVVTVLRGHPDGIRTRRHRQADRHLAADRLPRPAGHRGRDRGRRLVGGRQVGRRRRGVPAGPQADPVGGDGRRPVGAADGPLRRQVRPGPRGRVREARRRSCRAPLAEHVERHPRRPRPSAPRDERFSDHVHLLTKAWAERRVVTIDYEPARLRARGGGAPGRRPAVPDRAVAADPRPLPDRLGRDPGRPADLQDRADPRCRL